jgi:hypothetical protein
MIDMQTSNRFNLSYTYQYLTDWNSSEGRVTPSFPCNPSSPTI